MARGDQLGRQWTDDTSMALCLADSLIPKIKWSGIVDGIVKGI